MKCVIGYYPGDLDQAERLASWIKELGVGAGHSLLVARDGRCPVKPFEDAGFDSVEETIVRNDVWQSWPQSANNVFRQCAIYIELVSKDPYWLWLENDSIPLTADAFTVLEAEYKAAGKPFMGDLVNVDNVPIHMSGIGIYPGMLTSFAGSAKLATETAWDVVGADQIVPQMHETGKISHAWKHPTFEDWAAVEREVFAIKPDCVLFHASKDGSLIRLLREKRNPPISASATKSRARIAAHFDGVKPYTIEALELAPIAAPAPITCDILIKSYPQDYPLLKYCLQSIARFAHGFQNVVLVVPEGEWPAFVNKTKDMPDNLKVNKVVEEGRGYLFQQVVKAKAMNYTVSDYVLHLDSDTILTTDINPEMFMREGKPIWFITPYSEACPDIPWRGCTQDFIKHPVEHEYMRRLPMFVPRKVHIAAADFCIKDQGVTIDKWIMDSQHFSEFNALGAVAWDKFHDEIYWFNTAEHPESEWPPLVALQAWSHAPFDETKKTFESILGTEWKRQERLWPQDSGAEMERPDELEPEPLIISNGEGEPPAGVDDFPNIEHPRQNLVVPWANQLESELEIKRLVGELKKFQTSPAYVNRVRMELKLARVIPGHKAIKRMKVRRRRLGGIIER